MELRRFIVPKNNSNSYMSITHFKVAINYSNVSPMDRFYYI